jgi:L-rhamnose isomerase
MSGKETSYSGARELYAGVGVDTEAAIDSVLRCPLSLHCWQGDDVGGFETAGAGLSGGGIKVTGSHPGRARNPKELREDLTKAFSLIPGAHRLNLHAMYGEFEKRTDRDAIEERHFEGWIAYARQQCMGLDFNATLFSHPLAADGFTLSHRDPSAREFWIEHVKRTRRIGARMGRELGTACIHNTWIPDGSKDLPADRSGFRGRLAESLDAALREEFPETELRDAVEGKLFGIGSESFVVGSHEFYTGYAITRGILITLDMGHFHPTESVGDKISALLPFVKGLLIHVSRGVRWDSDHVAILNDELRDLFREAVRSQKDGDGRLPIPGKISFGLDFFDATINRVGAWAIGGRAARKALLLALLEPREKLLEADAAGDGFTRLALMERELAMPWHAVWEQCCTRAGVPVDSALVGEVHRYERDVLSRRP